jgi:hypothetical protein
MRHSRFPLLLVGATMLGATSNALAQGATDSELAALRAQVEALMNRIEQLEQREQRAATAPPAVEPAPAVAAIATPPPEDRIRFSGDLRYRHETINDELASERNRHRIRARFGMTADVNEDVTLGLTLATGGDDPISGNQTLDNGFSRKEIGVDRAFFAWDISDSLTLRGGKMANPFFRPGGHHLLYDNDLNPEGLAVSWESGSFFVNAAEFLADERSAAPDGILLGAQGGITKSRAGGAEFTAGFSYYDYQHTKGYAPFFENEAFGNQLDANGHYLYDFDEVELFFETSLDAGGQPLLLFADYVTNTAADAFDTGYAFGVRYRNASAPHTWDIGWAYQDLEANAVMGTFTDSDFGGGGTDVKGHVFRADYALQQRLMLGLTFFVNEPGNAYGNQHEYKRLQADVSFRY